jgi:hypothetical protein
MILGMDIWVFTAWIGTIIAAIFCLLYGCYWYLKKTDRMKFSKEKIKKSRKKGVN